MEALKDALQSCTNFTDPVIDTILDICNFCMHNSVVHFRGRWFRSESGVPTGGPESGSIANIYVRWMLDKHILTDPLIAKHNKMIYRKRFLDDIWFIWTGSERQFEKFKRIFNSLGSVNNFTVKGIIGFLLNFLDIQMMLINGDIETLVYIKPTDSRRYLNRRSDHSLHVFKSIPFSQFRRAVVICSNEVNKIQ